MLSNTHKATREDVMLLCQMGNMPDALARDNAQRFARDVMPDLRDLWSDYENP